ncbi:MAG: carboxypeptidase-like regulatory domain-containing protein [bacterium]
MKKVLTILTICCLTMFSFGQEETSVKGKIVVAGTINPLESVNIVNLNQVIGTTTNGEGAFEINAALNDTLHLSYLGYKSIKVRVTSDWIRYQNETIIEMTELALALEEVVVKQLRLTGYLEVDIAQVPVVNNARYSISGLPSTAYETKRTPGPINRVLGSIFNPADFLYKMFGKRPRELRKLRKMKEDDKIRNLLAARFDREMLLALLQVERVDLDLIVSECDYSQDFINTANDLQILDAISECYEEYKVMTRKKLAP